MSIQIKKFIMAYQQPSFICNVKKIHGTGFINDLSYEYCTQWKMILVQYILLLFDETTKLPFKKNVDYYSMEKVESAWQNLE